MTLCSRKAFAGVRDHGFHFEGPVTPVPRTRPLSHCLHRRVVVTFTRISALFVVLVVAYPAWSWWNVRQLHAFCAAADPATPVSALSGLAELHGYGRHWIESASKSGADGAKVIYVPSAATFGEVVCAIQHGGTVVTSARVRN